MKIGFSGAQSVGKTTLLNALRKERMFENHEFRDEVTRWVGGLGLPINETGNDATQQLIAMRHIYNLRMYDNFVTDRTILDCYVYTRWLWSKQLVSDDTNRDVESIMDTIKLDYDHMFYIRPEFAIEDDGVRSADQKFQNEIVQLFEDALFEKFYDDEYTILTGSVEERVTQVKQTVKGLGLL